MTTQFDRKEYDLTNNFELVCGCCMTTKLILEPEVCSLDSTPILQTHELTDVYTGYTCPQEAVLTQQNICETRNKRMPYGELGSVDKNTACGCCTGVGSNLKPEGISPKCGCEEDTVSEVVAELKARMKARGDTGNIQRAEQQIEMIVSLQGEVKSMQAKLDAIMSAVKASPTPPPSPPTMARDD